MSNIDKQWLQQKIAGMEATRDEIPFGLDEDDSNTLAAMKLALASLEAEAVAWRVAFRLDGQPGSGFEKTFENQAKMNEIISLHERAGFSASITPLYTAPPALVSVPDERYQHLSELYHAQEKRLFKLAQLIKGPSFDKYAYSPSQAIDVLESEIFGAREDACRADMLQGAENAGAPTTMKTAPDLDSSPKIAESTSGNSPVIPDGWVACSERMPTPNQYVLVCNGVWVGMGMHSDSEHIEDDERWQDEHHEFIDLLHHPVTHWMPLPAAPHQES